MGKLYFKIGADYEKVIKLREEIGKLKQELLSMDKNRTPAAVAALEVQLGTARKRMDELVVSAAKAGAVMENDLKKGIFDASQTVNDLTEKIITQKTAIGSLQSTVRKNKDLYKTIISKGGDDGVLLGRIRDQEKALWKEKDALFNLTQQQANARLSVRKLKDEYSLYQEEGQNVVDSNNNMALSFKKTLAAIGGTAMIKKFVSDVVRVRGEFQQLDVSLTTLLQSKDKASKLMSQIVKTAAETPFNMTELATGAKQLVAYGFQAEEINGTLVRLGNIASGLGLPLERLTYLYGTTMTQGRLYARDLNQFTTSGIPMLQGLADMFGVSTDKVNKMVSAGKIGFPEVQKVIENMTNEGGKFFNLMEEQSKTITGKISNLGDAWDEMLNKIGQSQEGVINDSIDGVKYLIENYEKVGQEVFGLITAYGMYKTAIIVLSVVEKARYTATLAMGSAEKTLTTWQAIRFAATEKLTVAQRALNVAMLKNPYVLIGVAVAGLTYGIYKLATAETAAEKAQQRFNESLAAQKRQLDNLKSSADELIETIKNETSTQYDKEKALGALQKIMPTIFKNMDIEKLKLMDILSLNKQIAEEINRRERIGAKTSLVLKTNAYNEAKERYSKTSSRNSNVLAYYAQMKSAEEDMKLAQKYVDDIERIQAEANKQKEKNGKKEIIKNKEHWSNQKKEAEKALESIASSQKKLMDAGKFDGIDTKIVESYKTNSKLLKEAEKELKVYDSSSKQESAAEKLRKQQEKHRILIDKQKLDQIRAEEDLQTQVDEAHIKTMEEGSKKTIAQMELNFEKEMQVIDRQKEDALRKKIEEARTAWEANPENKKKSFDATGIKLSDEDIKGYDSLYKSKIEEFEKDKYRMEAQSMRDYLKEYGTFQQQKLAIAEEYAEKIKNAQSKGEILKLEKERDTAILNKETEAIKSKIDWVTVFGEFGGMFNDMIKPALEEAKKYIKTDEFKNSDQASQKTLIDAINQMEKSLSSTGGLNFKKLGQDVQVYQNALRNLNNATNEETQANERLTKAKETYEKAVKGGTEQEKLVAKDALDIAQLNADAASANVKAQTDIANQSQQDVTDTATGLRASMENVTEGLAKMASSGLKSAYDGLIQAGKGMGGSMEKIAKKLEDVPIIGWIVSIIDVLKDGLSNLVGGILDAVFNAISGIISDIFSGDLFVTIFKSLRDGIGNILNSISFGGWNTLMGKINGSDEREVNKLVEKLTESNKYLSMAIDKLTGEMEKSGGLNITKYYEAAKDKQKEKTENDRQMLEAKMGYNSAHHSNNYYINEAFSADDWKKASDYIGKQLSSASDLWKLTPEELAKFKEIPDIWEKINSGKYDQSEYLDAYLEDAEKLEELTRKWQETLTQTSFDSFVDSFKSALADMDSSAEDFADDFQKYMMNAIINSFVNSEEFQKRLKGWYTKFADYAKDGKIDPKEKDDLKDEYDGMVKDGLEYRDNIADIMGFKKGSSSQQATNGGFQTMSQDTGSELNGRFTALQIAGEEIKNQSIQQTGLLSSINEKISLLDLTNKDIPALTSGIPNIADQTRESVVNSYQPQINVIFPDTKIDVLTAEVSTLKDIVNEMRTFQVDGNLDRQEIREGIQIISKNSPKILNNTDSMKRDIKNAM